MTTATRPKWIAGRDGTAHAHRAGYPRTVCGAPRVDERFAWPRTSRCLRCVAITEGADS
jgi:hypothetical protein